MTIQQARYCGVMSRVRPLLLFLLDDSTGSVLFYCDFSKRESKLSVETFPPILHVKFGA